MTTPNTFINEINEACALWAWANPGLPVPRGLIVQRLLRGCSVDETSTISAVGFPHVPTTDGGAGGKNHPCPAPQSIGMGAHAFAGPRGNF